MERKRNLKLTKWACWKLYHKYGLQIDAETMLGYKKSRISDDVWRKVVEVQDWADEMLDYIDIRDGRSTPHEYNDWVLSHAMKHGKLLMTDAVGLYIAGGNSKSYLDRFNPAKVKQLKSGDRIEIVSTKIKDREYVLKRGERIYIPNRPNEITVTVQDHLGKFIGDKSLVTKKAIVDKASEYNSDHRDVFGYSPVAVSQFNRAVGDIQRVKHANGDLSPQLEDFKDSGGLT